MLMEQEQGVALNMLYIGGFIGIVAYDVIILIQLHQQVRSWAIYITDLKNMLVSSIIWEQTDPEHQGWGEIINLPSSNPAS